MELYDFMAYCLIFGMHHIASAYPSDVCLTRAGRRGTCKPMKDCPPAYQDFHRNILPTPCGFSGWYWDPMVCCPTNRRKNSGNVRLQPAPVHEYHEEDFSLPKSPFKGYKPYRPVREDPTKDAQGDKSPFKGNKPYGQNYPFFGIVPRIGIEPPPVHEDHPEDDLPPTIQPFYRTNNPSRNKTSSRRRKPSQDHNSSEGNETLGRNQPPIEDQFFWESAKTIPRRRPGDGLLHTNPPIRMNNNPSRSKTQSRRRKPSAGTNPSGGSETSNRNRPPIENESSQESAKKFPEVGRGDELLKTNPPMGRNNNHSVSRTSSGRQKPSQESNPSKGTESPSGGQPPTEDQSPGERAKKMCDEISQAVCPVSSTGGFSSGVRQFLVQGEKSLEREFPHMAAIGYGSADNILWLCGGSLISEKFVLTAAHCLTSRESGSAQWVHLGAEVLKDSLRGGTVETMLGQTHPIIRRIRHPDYRPPAKYNDIALLELDVALGNSSLPTLGESIYPACLHLNEDPPVARGTATGWGRVGFGEDLSPDLLKVELSIADQSVCNESYQVEISSTPWLVKGIDSSLICAGEMGEAKDTCLGDSGGPIQYLPVDSCVHKILAITSFGKVCGLGSSPGAYTSVSYFVPWIESVVWPKV